MSTTDNAEIERRHGWPLLVLSRPDLLRVLLEALPAESLRSGSAMSGVRVSGDALLVSHRSGVARGDLVVGADGLHSDVRHEWWPHARGPLHTGRSAWRMITDPLPDPPTEGAVIWGDGARIGYTALPAGRFYCFAATRGVDTHSEFRQRFGDWPAPVPALLAGVPDSRVLRNDLYRLAPLPSYVRGRIVLVGDAAHPMDPILGQGACQAIEDAVTLAACLDATDTVDSALFRYDRLRRPRTQAISRRAARLSAVALCSARPAGFVRDLAARLTPASAALRSMDAILGWAPPTVADLAGG